MRQPGGRQCWWRVEGDDSSGWMSGAGGQGAEASMKFDKLRQNPAGRRFAPHCCAVALPTVQPYPPRHPLLPGRSSTGWLWRRSCWTRQTQQVGSTGTPSIFVVCSWNGVAFRPLRGCWLRQDSHAAYFADLLTVLPSGPAMLFSLRSLSRSQISVQLTCLCCRPPGHGLLLHLAAPKHHAPAGLVRTAALLSGTLI